MLPSSLSRSQPRADSVTNEFAFKLRDAGKNTEDQPTIERTGVNAFVDRDEVDA
jgi:hypothetical protein